MTDLRDQVELDVRMALDSLHSADAQVKTAEEGLHFLKTRWPRPSAATGPASPTASK